MTDELPLAPCPFCGGTPSLETRDVEPQSDPWYGPKVETFVLCACGCCLFDGYFHEGFRDDHNRAADAWNKRARGGRQDELLSEIERLTEALQVARDAVYYDAFQLGWSIDRLDEVLTPNTKEIES